MTYWLPLTCMGGGGSLKVLEEKTTEQRRLSLWWPVGGLLVRSVRRTSNQCLDSLRLHPLTRFIASCRAQFAACVALRRSKRKLMQEALQQLLRARRTCAVRRRKTGYRQSVACALRYVTGTILASGTGKFIRRCIL